MFCWKQWFPDHIVQVVPSHLSVYQPERPKKVHLHIFVPYRNSLNIPSFWHAFLTGLSWNHQVPELFACSQQQLRGLVDFQKKTDFISFLLISGIFYML